MWFPKMTSTHGSIKLEDVVFQLKILTWPASIKSTFVFCSFSKCRTHVVNRIRPAKPSINNHVF